MLAKGTEFVLEFVIIAGGTLLAIFVTAPLVDLHVASGRLALTTGYTALFSLSFGLIAFALQAASRRTHRLAVVVAVAVGFGGYLLASLSGLTDWLKTPAKFMPYHYFNPEAVLRGQPVHGLDIYLVGVVVLTIVVSYVGFRRRDIS